MYLEALKSKQREVFKKLSNFSEFYLTGGTALALQIGHRISLDFDLFSEKKLPTTLLRKIRRVFREFKIVVIFKHSEQISVLINGTKVDFVKYKFPPLLKLIKFKGIKMAQVPEIGAMKAYALSYRATFKDYIDLYFILKNKHSTLNRIKEIGEKKYGTDFNFRLFLEQLIYLKDVKEEKIEFLKEKVTLSQMEKFFEKEIKKIKL